MHSGLVVIEVVLESGGGPVNLPDRLSEKILFLTDAEHWFDVARIRQSCPVCWKQIRTDSYWIVAVRWSPEQDLPLFAVTKYQILSWFKIACIRLFGIVAKEALPERGIFSFLILRFSPDYL
jgi:hypothetical protein